jgi:hypothetical protein
MLCSEVPFSKDQSFWFSDNAEFRRHYSKTHAQHGQQTFIYKTLRKYSAAAAGIEM